MDPTVFIVWVILVVLVFAMGALALFMLHMLTVSESLSLLLLDVIAHKEDLTRHNKHDPTRLNRSNKKRQNSSADMEAAKPDGDSRRRSSAKRSLSASRASTIAVARD
ncbi:hypothetical protein LSAT2_011640, partial [Lamellibrachia satsuma]